MQTTTSSFHSHPRKPTSQTYPPTVPIYVYRELATELQATQAKLDALITTNQQLVQQNQLLRHEITKVVQSFSHLQKLADSSYYQAQPSYPNEKSPPNNPFSEARQQTSRSRQPVVPEVSSRKSNSYHSDFSAPVMEINPPISETVFIEEQPVNYYTSTHTEVKEFSGWWLAVTILLIMLSAFGAGYLIVRPLFEHQSR